MQIVGKIGNDNIATVYMGKTNSGNLVEFVESVQPPIPREKKWVLIVSTLMGYVVGCPMCDAGSWYKGTLSKEEILEQIDYLIKQRFPVPSLSTVAPLGCEDFFTALLETKAKYYDHGRFQLQFSMHTTDIEQRDKIIPIKKWSFAEIAKYGEKFCGANDKKISLNFALAKKSIFNPEVLKKYFDPEIFLIKITPVNPTLNALKNNITSYIIKNAADDYLDIVGQLKALGFEVIVSIGELEENKIGSNCGQYVKRFLENKSAVKGAYEYGIDFYDDI